MSLYNKAGTKFLWCKFNINGERVQRSTGTTNQKEAREFEARLKVELLDKAKQGITPVYLWNDAVVKYLGETKHKASQESDKVHLRWLDKHLNGVKLQEIKRDLLDKIVADRQSEGVKPSTVNRVMEVVRCILNKAHREWEWIDRVPPVQMLKEPTKRVRWITREEADKLVAALPPHLAVMAEFSLQTGLRRHNVTHLEWSQLDLVKKRAWVHPDQAKAGKAISVPLSDVAVDLIRQQLGKQTGKASPYVFLYHGEPVYQTSTKAWHDALIRVGITKFRWHDLRHTWASWHVQRGTPLPVLKELGGWATYEMVLKYAHLACDHLAEYVNPKPGVATEVATVEEKRARQLA